MVAYKEASLVKYSMLCGMWLSLVERLTGGQEVVGSNPAIPIFYAIIFRFVEKNPYFIRVLQFFVYPPQPHFGGSRCRIDRLLL